MLIQFLSPKDLHPSAATQTSLPPGGQSGVNWSAVSNAASNGTSRWTHSSNQSSSQTPSRTSRPDQSLRSGVSSSQDKTEIKSSQSRPSATLSTESPGTPTSPGLSPKSSAQVSEFQKPTGQSPSGTVPARQSLGSTATAARSPPPLELHETPPFNHPESSSLPPTQLFTVTPVTSLSQQNTKATSPITAAAASHTNTPVSAASASRSPSSLTANSQSAAASVLTGRTTGGRGRPGRPPTKITGQSPTAAAPSSPSQPSATVEPGGQSSPTTAPGGGAANASQSLANVEPVSQSAPSVPAAFTDRSSQHTANSSQSGTSPVPPHLSPTGNTTASPASVQSTHAPSSTASNGQAAPPDRPLTTSVSTNQSTTGSASRRNTMSGVFPPDEHPANISLLARQAKESLKSSLRRISGRDFYSFILFIFKFFPTRLTSFSAGTHAHDSWNEQEENSLYLIRPSQTPGLRDTWASVCVCGGGVTAGWADKL